MGETCTRRLISWKIPSTDLAEVYAVTHKALASAIKVIARADDSSGIIGDACRRLLDLHPKAAASARVPCGMLIDWMMKFQFDDDVDYFGLDPVAYAPALGETGMKAYRKRLSEIEANLGPRPSEEDRWTSGHSHDWFALDWNAQRLAVLDHDIDAIIRTHAKDPMVAAWLEDTAEAFEEIGEIDLAIDSDHTWSELVKVYEKVDRLAVLPTHQRLVENELVEAGAQHYRLAARRLAKMRKLAAGSGNAVEVDELIADLRQTHLRRPRLQQEFDHARLP